MGSVEDQRLSAPFPAISECELYEGLTFLPHSKSESLRLQNPIDHSGGLGLVFRLRRPASPDYRKSECEEYEADRMFVLCNLPSA